MCFRSTGGVIIIQVGSSSSLSSKVAQMGVKISTIFLSGQLRMMSIQKIVIGARTSIGI